MWQCVCAAALLCAALSHAAAFKRAEMSPSPFVLISRYGRASPRMLTARNDRFFLTGRYGKRSEAGYEAERLALKMIDNANRDNGERQRQRSMEKERNSVLRKWRPRPDYPPYYAPYPLHGYYKRNSDTLDTSKDN